MTLKEDAIAYFRRHKFTPEEAELAYAGLDRGDVAAIERWVAAGRPGPADPVMVPPNPLIELLTNTGIPTLAWLGVAGLAAWLVWRS